MSASAWSSGLHEASPVEEVLQQLQIQWQGMVQRKQQDRASRIQEAFAAAELELAAEVQHIADHVRQKELDLLLREAAQQARHSEERERRIRQLQRDHEKQAALAQQQVDKILREELERQAAAERAAEEQRRREAAAREEAERQRQQQEAAAAAEAERKKREEAEAKAKEEAAKAAAAAAAAPAAAPQQQAQAAPAAAGAAAGGAPAASDKVSGVTKCMRAAPTAVTWEKAVSRRFVELQGQMEAILADEGLKKQRRDVEKKMTVHVQQISATLDQIQKKCHDVYSLIAGMPDMPWRLYAMHMFATKVLRQWELILLNNKAAFPLATVLVKVSSVFPELMDLALGLIHRECVFAVPLAFVHEAGAMTAGQHRRLMGYAEKDDPEKQGVKVFESCDEFIRRVEGVMLLYGAIVQVDESRHPHSLDAGWRWLARFLNALPASRSSAKALICFLRTAGFAMHRRYQSQFIKLLKCMYEEYLPELARCQEPDVQSVRTLLEHYLTNAQYGREPEGRSMPKIDVSTYSRA